MTLAILNNKNIATSAGDVTIFNFNNSTREYLSTSVEYLVIGVGIPASSCVDIPLKNKDGYAVCRTSDLSSWEYIADHRGETIYSIETGERISVIELGDYPSNTTTISPQTAYDKWIDNQWVTDVNAQLAANITIAKKEKSHLLQEAQATINLWQTELQLGIISDEDKASLIAWLAYIKVLKNTDISNPSNINWPLLPNTIL